MIPGSIHTKITNQLIRISTVDETIGDQVALIFSAGPVTGRWNSNAMRLFCLDRHNQNINAVFLDLSARKVGLKELWTLKWHKEFDTSGYQGGWPEWMQKYRDY